MNKRAYWIIGIVVVLLLIGLMLMQQRTRFNWRETYTESNDPYGTQVIKDLLEGYSQDSLVVVKDSLRGNLDTSISGASYVFIGQGMYLDSADTRELMAFVERGNQAFLSSKTVPYDLMFYMLDTVCYDGWWEDYYFVDDTLVQLQLSEADVRLDSVVDVQFLRPKSEVENTYWSYLGDEYFCPDDFSPTALGYFSDSLVNFARFPYGEGAFYLHTNPMAFANIHLLKRTHLDYASGAFSYLEQGPIYWDGFSRVPESVARRMNSDTPQNNRRRLSTDSPLQYILSQPALAWAWYLALALGLLYLIFYAKRRQRVIPVLPKKENTSLQFVQLVGRLFFLQQNHRKAALQQLQFFFGDIRAQYQMNTNQLDTDFIERLAARTTVPEEIVEKIVRFQQNIKSSNFVSENTLMELHTTITEFWELRK